MIQQHRGVVVGRNGIVAASQPLAVSAGLQILQEGGTFIDAAISISSVLAVTEPYASQLGGDAFVIVFEAKTGRTLAFNASGAAPGAANRGMFPDGIPIRGVASASVPGLVDCWFALHDRYGSLPMSRLLKRSIDYAREGFPAGYRHTRAFRDNLTLLKAHPESDLALNASAEAADIRPGRNVVQPDLAWSLQQIAECGRSAFYDGAITERMLAYSADNGGLFCHSDFADHHTDVLEPIQTEYRGYTVHGQPPVSQGHILLQELNIVEGYDMAGFGHNSANAIHVQVEAKKRAFADRHAYVGDPAFVRVPLQSLLSRRHADEHRLSIDLGHASEHVDAGSIEHDTTYFCAADAAGNAVSFIQSIFWGFGSAATATGTGVLFNNRMTGFSLDPASPNVLEPGKRTVHTLNAYLLTRPGDAGPRLAYVGGTPGGDIQVQSNLQVVCNIIDFGMNPQQAIETARWQHGGSVGAAGEAGPGILSIEDRVPGDVRKELERRGHQVNAIGPWEHGSSYQLIAVDKDNGAYMAGSDPRCDGHAAGF